MSLQPDELERLLADENKTPTPALPQEEQIDYVKKAQDELANLNRAKAQALKDLKDIRDKKKAEISKPVEEELPQIDMTDPSSQAWDKRIKESVNPYATEIEKAKEERRNYVLGIFLQDKPSLASNPEKISELMSTYEKLRTATEMTNEGIMIDLRKSYSAVFYNDLQTDNNSNEVDKARADMLYSDIGVSRGSTSYSPQRERTRVYTDEEKKILASWGTSPEEHLKDIRTYGQK